jgi:hypothetical protein
VAWACANLQNSLAVWKRDRQQNEVIEGQTLLLFCPGDNELIKYSDGSTRTKLHRLIKNLIAKATTADDALDKDGNIIKEGTGDLSAIQEIINRLEGKPSQKIVGPDDGPVRIEYRTIEEVRMFLLERGIDSMRVPPPPMRVISKD